MEQLIQFILIILAAAFFAFGFVKVFVKKNKILKYLPWLKVYPPPAIRILGILEISAAFLIVYSTMIVAHPYLLFLIMIALLMLMTGAFATHAVYGENKMMLLNIILGLFAAFAAFYIFRVYIIGSVL